MPADLGLLLVVRLLVLAGRSGRIAVPITATGLVDELVEGSDLTVIRTPASVGELTRAATEDGVVLAAAPTGGFVFPDVVPGYDAVTALCKLLELLAAQERPVSELVAELPRPTLVHRALPCPWGRKGLVMRLLNEQLASRTLDLMDGVKAYDERGWVQVLPDPDEPLVHLYAEGDDRGRSRASSRTRSRSLVERDRAGRRDGAANPGTSLKLRLTPWPSRLLESILPGRKVLEEQWTRFPTWHT